MGLGQNILGQAGLFFDAQVGSATSESGNFPPKIPIFPLCVNKISSGRVKKYLGQWWIGPLFTAGQGYARSRSEPISTFLH